MSDYQDYIRRAGEALDGKAYTLDGVSGTIRYRDHKNPRWRRISHEADAAGKKSEKYVRIAKQLGDDYDTDLTDSERLIDILCELGIESEVL